MPPRANFRDPSGRQHAVLQLDDRDRPIKPVTERRAGLTDLELQPVTVISPVILVDSVLLGFGIVSISCD